MTQKETFYLGWKLGQISEQLPFEGMARKASSRGHSAKTIKHLNSPAKEVEPTETTMKEVFFCLGKATLWKMADRDLAGDEDLGSCMGLTFKMVDGEIQIHFLDDPNFIPLTLPKDDKDPFQLNRRIP